MFCHCKHMSPSFLPSLVISSPSTMWHFKDNILHFLCISLLGIIFCEISLYYLGCSNNWHPKSQWLNNNHLFLTHAAYWSWVSLALDSRAQSNGASLILDTGKQKNGLTSGSSGFCREVSDATSNRMGWFFPHQEGASKKRNFNF